MEIIIKKWEHYNRSFKDWDTPQGKYIKNKDHYESELKKSGMVSVDKAGQVTEAPRKEYKLSKKAVDIINAAKNSSRNGKVKLSDNAIKAMVEIGAISKKIPSYMKLPNHYEKGGFDVSLNK